MNGPRDMNERLRVSDLQGAQDSEDLLESVCITLGGKIGGQ